MMMMAHLEHMRFMLESGTNARPHSTAGSTKQCSAASGSHPGPGRGRSRSYLQLLDWLLSMEPR